MNRIWTLLLALSLLAGGTACKKAASAGPAGAGGMSVRAVVVEARVQPVTESLSLVGTIAANESVEIKSQMEGLAEEVLFKEGEIVQEGALLVRVDENKLAAAVAESEANFRLGEANHARAKQLLVEKLISQQEFDQISAQFQAGQATLELRRRQLKEARIVAPFGGIVGARQISPGQLVGRDTTITWIVDLDPVKVEVDVPERYLGQVSLGQKVAFAVAAFPKDRFEGEVYFISPQLNSTTRTALIKARIPNPDRKLKGGMFASLALTVQLRDAAIVIPEPALMSNGDAVSVFVVDAQSKAQLRPVTIGLRLAGMAEVVTGLAPGEKVVVEGVQKLGPGVTVQPAPPESAAPYLPAPTTGSDSRRA